MSGIGVFGVDEQADHPIDVGRWVRLAEQVLVDRKVRGNAELSVLFVDEVTMTDLNRRHMGVDGPTDVLAFPIDEDGVEPGRWPDNGSAGPDRPPVDDDLPRLLGDVVICPAYAARQAAEHAGGPHHDGSLDDEIALLVVHGILHVLGMDHAEPDETAAMQAAERELLGRFHRPAQP